MGKGGEGGEGKQEEGGRKEGRKEGSAWKRKRRGGLDRK